MGMFSKLGGKKDYPALASESTAAHQLENMQDSLAELVDMVHDKLEVLPDDDAAFVFIGKPPKKFGVAWIEDGEVMNLNKLAQEKGVSPVVLQDISEELRKAYEKNQDAERYQTEICGKAVVVTPCDELKKDVESIISKVLH